MKKNLILAVVAVMALGQAAHAGTEKDGKPEGARRAEAEKAKGTAKESATHGADAGKAENPTLKAVRDAKLGKGLKSEHKAVLESLVNDPAMKAIVDGIVAQAANFPELANARLEALIYADVAKIDKGLAADAMKNFGDKGKYEQAYRTLAEEAGDAANSWTPQLRDNLTFLLKTANRLVSEGIPVADAMVKANAELKTAKSVTLDISKINEYCKKKRS